MEIKHRLIEARKKKGLGQEAVMEITGIHQNTLSNWERGVYTPSAENILKLCECYDVSPNWLLGYEDKNSEFYDMLRRMIRDGAFDFLLTVMAKEIEARMNSVFENILKLTPPGLSDELSSLFKMNNLQTYRDKSDNNNSTDSIASKYGRRIYDTDKESVNGKNALTYGRRKGDLG